MHVSESFLFCPSLPASLYLLLLRFLARQYEAVVSLAGQCVTDCAPSAEEAQICALLEQANDDRHPDAHACRLHISLCTLHTPLSPLLPWTLSRELLAYVKKLRHVSVNCRLEAEHELLLLQHVSSSPPASGAASEKALELLSCRRMILDSARSAKLSGPPSAVRIRVPCPQPGGATRAPVAATAPARGGE